MADRTITTEFIGKDRISPATESASRSTSKLGGVLGKVGGVMKTGIGAGAAAAGVGLAAVGGFLVQGVKDAASYTRKLAQTAQVIKSTGNVAGISVNGVKNLAAELESMSGVDEELIINSQNVLATFTNIRNVGKNKIFDQATKSALDMSQALGTDLQGASIQVGKALNDPIKGVTALSKVGVSFTAQQKDQIKTLVANGKTMDAQKLILRELNKEFGGQAKAAGKGFEGAMARVQDAISDTGREIGLMLLPKLAEAGEWLAQKIPVAVQQFKDGWKGINASTDVGALAESLKGLATSIGNVSKAAGDSKANGFVRFAKWGIQALTTLSDGIQLFGANWSIITNKIKSWNTTLAINWQKTIVSIAEAGSKLPGPMGRHFKKIADDGRKRINELQGSLNKTNTRVAQSRVEALEIKLRHLGHQRPTPQISANIRQAQDQIARIRAKLLGIRDRYVNVFVSEVNRDRATAGRAGRASGGPIMGGKAYLVGENGPEVIRPKGQGQVMTTAATRAMLGAGGRGGGGDTYIIQIAPPPGMYVGTVQQMGDQIVKMIESRPAGSRKLARNQVGRA